MNKNSIIYLLGIGGMGMCPLAIYLRHLGHRVVGFDKDCKPSVRRLLADQGICVNDCLSLPEGTVKIVYSSAIKEEHPIFAEALQKNIPIVKRGLFLAEYLKEKKLIAVVGSHGKTTTTAFLIHFLNQAGFDFGYLLGGLYADETLLPARASSADWVVAEIDESDGTIEAFRPEITLVVNFDWDHHTYYQLKNDLEKTFKRLLTETQKAVFFPHGCVTLQKAVQGIKAEVFSYEKKQSSVEVPYFKELNEENAIAAQAVAKYLLCVDALPKNALDGFLGLKRRQEVLFQNENQTILLDYAHHPTEIRLLLNSVAKNHTEKIVVVFQPHRHSRTKALFKELAFSLLRADDLILLPVYAADEVFDPEGTSEKIEQVLAMHHLRVFLLPSFRQGIEKLIHLHNEQKEPSLVLFVGAGDIEILAHNYTQYLEDLQWSHSFKKRLSIETKVKLQEPLAKKTTIGVGGNARFFIEPSNKEDLIYIIERFSKAGIPIFTLGRGSNLIIPDEGFQGLVIRFNHPNWKKIHILDKTRMYVEVGVRLKEICGQACKLGMSGFEFLEGIPGSLGGALRMNAGAMGGWLFDVVETVECLNYKGDIQVISKESLTLGYRYCEQLKNSIALGATLKSPGLVEAISIREKIQTFTRQRKASQPKEPSAGCIFKNPENNCAGHLIDSAGLKGVRVGGAQVSSLHANFIINAGGATSKDIMQLVYKIRKRVYATCGILLEPEVLLLGKTWESVFEEQERHFSFLEPAYS